jgi:hypothetical protein
MLQSGIREAATVLLESAIRIAPPSAQEWGRAMRGELSQVENPWAGTLWALGGTSVMVKETLVSLVVPNSAVTDGGLFARSPALRRAATVIGAASVLTALLFFVSPPYRQAFRVAITPWLGMVHAGSTDPQHSIHSLARRAEADRDAEGLAFSAVRTSDAKESARLARLAVKSDPRLLWIYGVLALRFPSNPDVLVSMPALASSDPQNSLIHIVAAENLKRAESRPGASLEQAWSQEMAAAFDATKFDDYSLRVARLTQTVVPRYRLYDPYEVEAREPPSPQFLLENTQKYAELLLSQGANPPGRGERSNGQEQSWTVARFGQMFDAQSHTQFEHSIGTRLQALAYRSLEKSWIEQGDLEQSELFGYLARKFDASASAGTPAAIEPAFGRETALRNAAVVEVSGLMIVVFFLFVIVSGSVLGFANRRRAGIASERAKPLAVIVLLTSALGVLFSTATLYLTYRPYWYIFQAAIASGEGVKTRDLHEFLSFTGMLPGVPHHLSALTAALLYSGSPGFLFFVWAGAVLFAVIGLALILFRRFMGRTTNSPK